MVVIDHLFSDCQWLHPLQRYSRPKSKLVRNRAEFWSIFRGWGQPPNFGTNLPNSYLCWMLLVTFSKFSRPLEQFLDLSLCQCTVYVRCICYAANCDWFASSQALCFYVISLSRPNQLNLLHDYTAVTWSVQSAALRAIGNVRKIACNFGISVFFW